VVIHAIVPDPTLTSVTRRVIYGRSRRVVLTHSPSLHAAQQAGFEQTLAKACGQLGELADRLARSAVGEHGSTFGADSLA
jgi:hypothetical protein